MMGFDTRLFTGDNDGDMVNIALKEKRILITRDTRIMERRLVTGGQVRAILVHSDQPEAQVEQVLKTLKIRKSVLHPFSLCIECNQPLKKVSKEEIKDLVPPYVYLTQHQFVQCPLCHRIYWQGTHWESMTHKIESLGVE